MKKLFLMLGLVIILAGSAVGGLALHAGAAVPALKLASNPGGVPGIYTFTGSGWNYPGTVGLFLDAIMQENQVASVKVSSNGAFVSNISIGTATLGLHVMHATQASNIAVVNFTVNSKPPTDPVLDNLSSQINNPAYGLAEIKSEIKDIQTNVTTIKNDVNGIETKLTDTPSFTVTQGHFTNAQLTDIADFTYDTIRHVSLTLWVGGTSSDEVWVRAHLVTDPLWVVADVNGVGVTHWEFDTDHWTIEPQNAGFDYQWVVTTVAPNTPPV